MTFIVVYFGDTHQQDEFDTLEEAKNDAQEGCTGETICYMAEIHEGASVVGVVDSTGHFYPRMAEVRAQELHALWEDHERVMRQMESIKEHIAQLERLEVEELRAKKKHTEPTTSVRHSSVEEMAQAQVNKFWKYAADGLPDTYTNFNDWLFDMFPDFPWQEPAHCECIRLVLNNPEFPAIEEGFQQRFSRSLKAELEKALLPE